MVVIAVIPSFRVGFTARLIMSVTVVPVTFIDSDMDAPVGMVSFPSMKAFQPDRVGDNPDIAGPQIIILVAYNADVFDAIPDITIGNYANVNGYRRCRCFNGHPAIGTDDTAGHQCNSRNAGNTQRQDDFIFIQFHKF
jgi:hypothetical protein